MTETNSSNGASFNNGNGLPDDLSEKPLTPEYLQLIMAYLRKNGLQETEESLSKEASAMLRSGDSNPLAFPNHDSIVNEFESLLHQVDSSYDFFQAEFSLLLFPVFAHCFLKLLYETGGQNAKDFFNRFRLRVPAPYEEQVDILSRISSTNHANSNTYTQLLQKNSFIVKMSRSCMKQLELLLARCPTLKNIIKDHITIEQSDVVSKLKSSVECQMGGILGQVGRNLQRHKMLHGVQRDELMQTIEKRKTRGKDVKDNKKVQATAPVADRIPMPAMSESYREEKRKAIRDASKLALVSQENPPSICMFTALNAHGGVTSADISDDSSLMALGFGDSTISIFAFDEAQKLKKLKDIDDLEKIDPDTDNFHETLYDDNTASTNVMLLGHNGPVYSVNFSPDKRLIVSSAKDNTVRLWSTDAQKNVVVYRLSMPVWQVQFCNRGYYFCTGSSDKCAALWCTDRMNPLRLFPDSYGGVSCVDFHPNCNYVVGGSDDRYVRIWDVLNGTCVRTFSGHKAGVRGVKVSPCGRYVVSVGGDGAVCVWDVAYNRLAGMENRSVASTMASISFSRDGGAFAVSHGGPSVSFYSLDNLIGATNNQNEQTFDPKINMSGFNIYNYPTKQTPVLGLHFTRRNLLLAVGSFNQ
ncbi:unnamed protein product [Auanema sp. JU1783]|nr:unnamed protein product [Auanema sp. JU1783]